MKPHYPLAAVMPSQTHEPGKRFSDLHPTCASIHFVTFLFSAFGVPAAGKTLLRRGGGAPSIDGRGKDNLNNVVFPAAESSSGPIAYPLGGDGLRRRSPASGDGWRRAAERSDQGSAAALLGAGRIPGRGTAAGTDR